MYGRDHKPGKFICDYHFPRVEDCENGLKVLCSLNQSDVTVAFRWGNHISVEGYASNENTGLYFPLNQLSSSLSQCAPKRLLIERTDTILHLLRPQLYLQHPKGGEVILPEVFQTPVRR